MTAATALPPVKRRRTPRYYVRPAIWFVLVTILVVVMAYPIVWILIGSFRTQSEFLGSPFWDMPDSFNFSNYIEAFTKGNLGQYISNSVLVVFPALILTLGFGVAAGFGLEVLVWKGRGPILLLFLAGIMVPGQMILLPLFTIYYQTGLTGTLWPLVITYVASGMPLTVFMMATYFRAVPKEMFEAATIDGANIFRIFWSIGVPVVKNAILTVGLVQFFFFWNDLLIALTFTNRNDLRTLQVGLLNFTGQYGAVQYGPLFAAISVSILGTLFLYLFLNQRVMKGLAAGSVK